MLEMKCDNNDGTINWENRAKIIVLTSKMAKMKRKDVLADIKDIPELTELVKKFWATQEKSKTQ